MGEHVKFYINSMPALDIKKFCEEYGYELYIEESNYKGMYLMKRMEKDAKM